MQKSKKKLIIIVAIVVIVAAAVAVAAYFYNSKSDNKNIAPQKSNCQQEQSDRCTAIKKAAEILNKDINNKTELEAVVNDIKKIKDYQKDPNLAYIVTLYGINAGNVSVAEEAYQSLAKTFKGQSTYDTLFVSPKSLEQLKADIDYVKVLLKQVEDNSFSVQEPS